MDSGLHSVQQPLDLVRLSLNNKVRVKLRYGRHLTGTLVAYDAHLNMLLHNVKEKVEKEVIDELLKHKEIKVVQRNHEVLYVRGDLVILISPQSKVVS